MKFKLDRRSLIIVAAVVVVGFALLARGWGGAGGAQEQAQPLDAGAKQACDDFEAGRRDATSSASRLQLADKVALSIKDTENDAVADAAPALGRDTDDNRQWRVHADAFTKTCRLNGWTAR
ncbi:hypothetical protein [Actinoplanes sp. NPDC089786]|uniref:hypothetical protein n=1 Tax=Actinoplanes sp. NPDC089786 TaxID=3155185 RepID=UPI0034299E5D